MAKARRRKESSFEPEQIKSVFLFGHPNKEKLAVLQRMQAAFVMLVNSDIQKLSKEPESFLQLVLNDKKGMRPLEKSMRLPDVNSAFCQNAFDMAVTHLANYLDTIRLELYAQGQTIFTQSKILFGHSIMGDSVELMINHLKELNSGKSAKPFYTECICKLETMSPDEFQFQMKELQDQYQAARLEYRLPTVRNVSVPLDSRLMKLEESHSIKAPYAITITNAFEKNSRFCVPIDTSRHSMHKIRSNKMAGTVVFTIKDGILRIGWSYKKHLKQPKTSEIMGVDVGISDTLHTSDHHAIGSMKDVIDFYHKEVEPAFAELSKLRNKKRSIRHYLHKHDLPEDVGRSLIQKMDRLEQMIQTMEAPYRKKRHYYALLDQEIKASVSAYLHEISEETLTVLEKLDMKEFKKSRRVNGMFSVFARGKLQEKLIRELNWHGYDFMEVVPDYTSQVCPVCSHLQAENRNGKEFHCLCCGYTEDADYVGSQNIRNRATDQEVLDACDTYKYNHRALQKQLKLIYRSRNEQYLQSRTI